MLVNMGSSEEPSDVVDMLLSWQILLPAIRTLMSAEEREEMLAEFRAHRAG
jgi:hypothetical protein